jgi:hypothetical protein
MAELTAVARHVRTDILRFLAENPHPRSKDSHWSSYAIAKKMGFGESTVWKVTTRFRECGVLEPEEPTLLQKPEPILRDLDNRPTGKHMRTTRTYRGTIPCRLTPRGRRLAELMRFARENGIFEIEPQKARFTQNETLVKRFKDGGFSSDEIEAAISCNLIYERKTPTYTPLQGIATPDMISGPRLEIMEYRYKYLEM